MRPLACQRSANASNCHHLGCVVSLLHHLKKYFGIFIDDLFKLICIPFKDFFASVQRASKRDNSNRTPGENTCFELGTHIARKFLYLKYI